MFEIFQLILTLILIIFLIWFYRRLKLTRLAVLQSNYNGRVEVYQKFNKELVLSTDYFPQGISTNGQDISKSYWYKIAQLVTKICAGKLNSQVLFLGLGANTSTSLISQLNPNIKQTVIEIDPVIIGLNKQFFNLDQTANLEVIQADAFEILKTNSTFKSKFDLIVIDIYQGNTTQVSEKSTTLDFIKLLLSHLKKDGVLIFNRPAHNSKVKNQNLKLTTELEKLFKEVEVKFVQDPRRYKNDLVMASKVKT